VRKSGGASDRFEGLTKVGREGAGGGNGVRVGLDLDGPVAAGGADELPDGPAVLATPAWRQFPAAVGYRTAALVSTAFLVGAAGQ
jgi:hypothetical protein